MDVEVKTINSEVIQKLVSSDTYIEAINYIKSNKNNFDEFENDEYGDFFIGRLLYLNGDYDEAKKYLLNSIRDNKKSIYSKFYLAQILKSKKEYLKALKLYINCASENKKFAHVLDFSLDLYSYVDSSDDKDVDNVFNSVDVNEGNSNSEFPKISIIIPCYNKVEYTKKCIESIFRNTTYPNYEIVAVDDASIDETPSYLETLSKRLKYLRLNKNFGFIGANNYGVENADGDFVLFLNNDTEVEKGWLSELYTCFVMHPDAGAVGARLIYPDGKQQEAGGIIFNDATGWNYGRNHSIKDPRYSFVREVDYCSGAALMVKKELYLKLGGFDKRFIPAYYEDTDLCFSIRKMGYTVLYCPTANVIHHEGITNGTDLTQGMKKHQILNAPKFIEKWKEELKTQYPCNIDLIYKFSNRKKGNRILIIDDIPPLPDRAAGALRHYHTLKQMLALGYQVTYAHLMGKAFTDKAAQDHLYFFKMMGVEFQWFNYESWWGIRNEEYGRKIQKELIESLDLKNRDYDLVYIAFWHIAEYFIDFIRQDAPSVPILIDTMDLHFLRELRMAETLNDSKKKKDAEKTRENEIAVYTKADCVTTVTEKDRLELKKYLPNKSILVLTDVHDSYIDKVEFENRDGLLFVGNFNHNPNEDAVLYFLDKIFPLILKSIPSVKFFVVGNNPTIRLKEKASENVIVTGWVPEIKPYLEKCRLSVVPLRFGAGNKGKVGETLSNGLPMVSTTIGAEGMNIINGVHSYISDDPKEFAEYVVRLYNDKEIWQEFSEKGKILIENQYSSSLMRKRLEYIMSFNSTKAFKTKKALEYPNPPKVSIVMVTYNQVSFTEKCLKSINKFTNISHEIILVDNNSSDNTVKMIEKDYPEIILIKNNQNLGFPKAVNQALSKALGEYICILNNDTIVTEGWIERMTEIADMDEKIGMVGPISNSVSGIQLDKEAKYQIDKFQEYAVSVKNRNKGELLNFPRIAFLCTLIKRKLVDEIGGLDERFSPGNYEDDDYCLRAQLSGFKTVIAKDVFIHHFGSKSFKADGENKYQDRLRVNRGIFIDKWGETPDDIWLKNKQIKPRQLFYPISKVLFDQYFERARINLADKEKELAIENIRLAIASFHLVNKRKFEIDLAELYDIAGNLEILAERFQSAKEYFEKELELNANSGFAFMGLSEVSLNERNFDLAREYLLKARENGFDPKEVEERLKNISEAENNFKDIISLEERLALAETFIEENKAKEALEVLMVLNEKFPENIDVMIDMSVAYIMNVQYDNAKKILNKILELNPGNELALNNLEYMKSLENNESNKNI